jgi:putative oxidoreductase
MSAIPIRASSGAAVTGTTAHGALLLRVSLGVMYLAHSVVLKALTFGLAGTAKFFESIGLPGPLAYVVFAMEAVGGVLLILGVKTRWVAAALLPVLAGATWTHAGNGWVFNAPNGGWEYPVFLAIASVVLILIDEKASR